MASGTPTGYASAALSGTKLLANNPLTSGLFGGSASQVGLGAGAGAAGLGLYGGLEQGGTAGDTQAALSAAQLGSYGATAAGLGGSALGTALSAAGPLSLALAPALIGMETPAVSLTPKYWTGVQNSLQQAISSGNKGTIASQVIGLLNQPQSQIPVNIQQLVYSTGFVPGTGWGTGTDPTQASNILTSSGSNTGGNGGHIAVGNK